MPRVAAVLGSRLTAGEGWADCGAENELQAVAPTNAKMGARFRAERTTPPVKKRDQRAQGRERADSASLEFPLNWASVAFPGFTELLEGRRVGAAR
jgi:hypothetical protein